MPGVPGPDLLDHPESDPGPLPGREVAIAWLHRVGKGI